MRSRISLIGVVQIYGSISKPPIKGINAISNIYKLSGLYLSSKPHLKQKIIEKYKQSDIKQKYFLSKIEPELQLYLKNEIENYSNQPIATLIKAIFNIDTIEEYELNAALAYASTDIDIQMQILLEDVLKSILTIKYINKTANDLVRDVLNNFSNAIQKIIKNRRKDHPEYTIKDEYDVQDILYVILKSIFPNLRDEDAIAKVGAKTTKIDLIIREEKILIEVKMIKTNDSNENKFIEELKVDFESYHECKWLNKLFCFVYDPYKKTKDISNFQDLNGDRVKGGHNFSVEVIIAN